MIMRHIYMNQLHAMTPNTQHGLLLYLILRRKREAENLRGHKKKLLKEFV